LGRAATGIDNAAGQRRGASPAEPVDHDDIGAGGLASRAVHAPAAPKPTTTTSASASQLAIRTFPWSQANYNLF
jgi:hypothetical protein